MGFVFALSQADAVGWICLFVGIVVLSIGVAIGLLISRSDAAKTTDEAKTKLQEASSRIAETKAHLEQTTSAMAESNLESTGSSAADATNAAQAAGESTEAAQTALEQVQGIVGSLPEHLRFAGVLVLVGTVLLGVATIQFGGVALF
jgi:methyl-accepting chemotaxis protein